MAMFEHQTPFEDGVKATAAGGGGGGVELEFVGSGIASSGASRPRLRVSSAETVVAGGGENQCDQCDTRPAAISRANTPSVSTSPSSSLSRSRQAAEHSHSSDNNGTSSSNITECSTTPLSTGTDAAATSRGASPSSRQRSNSPTVGMRGGEGKARHAGEPIRGLAAFGSQGSLNTAQSTEKGRGRIGSSRLSPRRPAVDPTPNDCSCQEEGGDGARARESNGTRKTGSGSNRGSAKSHSPCRVGGKGFSGGGRSNACLAGGSGSPAAAGVPLKDPGYRILQWSDLSHLTYMTMGAMCEIYSAELEGSKVAVKIPRSDCEEPAVAEHDLEVELDVLKRVSHKHIIALIGAGKREEKPHRFLVLEFLELGTLADRLEAGSNTDGTGHESTFLRRQKRTKRYQDFYMVTMLERSLELAMALEHLHHHMPETFVVHRDLKPDNVGFKADGTLKLFDFGLARVVKRRNRVNARYEMTGETGSMRYMAPEVVESLPYNEKVDVYAFGLLLWEMLEDSRVFDGMGVTDFYERVVNAGARPNLDPLWPQDLRKLISQCWHADVDRRPNFRVIAERLRVLYSVEKHSSKLCMSALNLNEDEHPKLPGGSAVNMLVRSATTTDVVSPRGRGGGPSSQSEIGNKKGGMLRRSFNKVGRMFKSNKGGVKATLTHTAPEAYARDGGGVMRPIRGGSGEDAMYAADGGEDDEQGVRMGRAQSDGMILRNGRR